MSQVLDSGLIKTEHDLESFKQIILLQNEEQKSIGEVRFLPALVFCMVSPHQLKHTIVRGSSAAHSLFQLIDAETPRIYYITSFGLSKHTECDIWYSSSAIFLLANAEN